MHRSVAITAAISAILLLAVAIISMRRPFMHYAESGAADVGISRGRIIYDSLSPDARLGGGRVRAQIRSWESPWVPVIKSSAYISLPLWPFVLGPAVIAVAACRRAPAGICRHCRYNLTGLQPSFPCPECGSPRPS